jgi:hypothetical protein
MDYLKCWARISRTGRIKNETIGTKVRMYKDILQVTEASNEDGTGTLYEWKTAKLLEGLQNGFHRGKVGAAHQSMHGRMGLTSACKEETSGIEGALIGSSSLSPSSSQAAVKNI